MTVKELRDKVLAAGGEIKVRDIVITYSEGNDVDVKDTSGNLLSFVSERHEGDCDDVAKTASVVSEAVFTKTALLMQWLQFLGIEVEGVKPITITERISVPDLEGIKLAGKVEAYENLLLNRTVSIGA